MDTPAPETASRGPLAPVSWTLFLALTAYGLELFAVGPCLTSIAATYGVALGATGVLFTAFFVGFIAGVLGGGFSAERVGKRQVVVVGMAILTAGTLLLALSPGPFARPHYWWALLAMFVTGIGGAAVESTASALVADVNPRRQAFALNLMQAFFGFGAIAGPLVVAAALARGWGWQTHFFISAGFSAVIFVALALQPVREQQVTPVSLRELGKLARHPAVLALCATMALYVGSEVGYTGWISALIQKRLGATAAVAGTSVTAFWATMTVGRLACTWLVEAMPPRRLMLILAVGGAAASAATQLAGAPWSGIVVAGMVGFFYSGVFGLVLTAASERFVRRRAVVFSLIMTCVGLGGMSLPAIMGAVAEAAGLRWAIALPAFTMAALAVVYAGIKGAEAEGEP